jgi:GTPase SAR1 family protein
VENVFQISNCYWEVNQTFERAILFMGSKGVGKSTLSNGICNKNIEIIEDEFNEIRIVGDGIANDYGYYGQCTKIPRLMEK